MHPRLLTFFSFINVSLKSDQNPPFLTNTNAGKSLRHLEENLNPDLYLDTAQIIRRNGYPSETHTVLTEDGYLLGIHRIPGKKNGRPGKQPVFLQHGLLSSSIDWVISNDSLAFLLANAGYDVWMGNCRGNVYSKAHAFLSPNSHEFWDFSWHEMALYDLPAVFEYIKGITGRPGQLLYVGHSMGTTMFFVLATSRPALAKNVKMMVALAPVAYMAHVTSPIRWITPFIYNYEWLAKYFGIDQFLPSNWVLRLLKNECTHNSIKEICSQILFLIAGYNKDEFNQKILSSVMIHHPSGTSTKTVVHYGQEIKNSGGFRQFDYGVKENMQRYDEDTPPLYPLENNRVPIYLMYGDGDILATPLDVQMLHGDLANCIGLYKIPLHNFGHVDFVYGKDAPQYVYQQVLQMFRNYSAVRLS